MRDKMKYEKYEAEIGYDADIDSLFGIVKIGDKVIATFYGNSIPELHEEFRKSVEAWESVCTEHGIERNA